MDLAWRVAKRIGLNEKNLREFLNETFSEVARIHNLDGTKFQLRAKVMGDAFEACFEVILRTFFPEINLCGGIELPEACMVGQGKSDFVIYSREHESSKRQLIAVIEAKGSADHIEGKDGRRIEIKRPGMTRTDTVKKSYMQCLSGFKGVSRYSILHSDKP